MQGSVPAYLAQRPAWPQRRYGDTTCVIRSKVPNLLLHSYIARYDKSPMPHAADTSQIDSFCAKHRQQYCSPCLGPHERS